MDESIAEARRGQTKKKKKKKWSQAKLKIDQLISNNQKHMTDLNRSSWKHMRDHQQLKNEE